MSSKVGEAFGALRSGESPFHRALEKVYALFSVRKRTNRVEFSDPPEDACEPRIPTLSIKACEELTVFGRGIRGWRVTFFRKRRGIRSRIQHAIVRSLDFTRGQRSGLMAARSRAGLEGHAHARATDFNHLINEESQCHTST